MKTLMRFLTVCNLVLAQLSISQWVQTNGPYGGGINDFIISDSVLITTNSAGLYYSLDSGLHWVQFMYDFPPQSFNSFIRFAKIGLNIFVATGYGGVFCSSDNGSSWSAVNNGLTNHFTNTLLASGTDLLVGTEGSGIFLSTNNGGEWTAVNSGLSDLHIITLEMYGAKVFAGTTTGIFRSSNSGRNWIAADSGLPSTTNGVHSFCSLDSFIFCVMDGKGIYRSIDSGASWTSVNGGLTSPWCLHKTFTIDTSIFVSTCDGIFRSIDNGDTWNHFNSPISQAYSYYATEQLNFIGGSDGVYRSTDKGVTWVQSNQGLTVPVKCVARNGIKLYAGTRSGGIFLTTDYGDSWIHLADCTGYVDGIAATDTTIFASNAGSSGHGPDGNVHRSTDNGKTWWTVNSGLTTTNVPALAISESFVFAGTLGAGVFRTSNNGLLWSQADSGLTNDTVWALATSDTIVFAGTNNGVFRSTNDGDIWHTSGLEGNSINALAASDSIVVAQAWPLGLCISTDYGTTWSLAPGESGSEGDGFLFSKSTRTATPALNISEITSLTANNDFLFAGTPHSVWKIPISKITSVRRHEHGVLPGFHLFQNYPNPFNPVTTIEYQIPQQSFVSLKIYDVLGREVATLVNEEKSAGNYSVQWDATNRSSGMYFYQLHSDYFMETRKLVLLR